MRPIIIEFYGLPGSGKSTIASRLISMLKTDCLTADDYLAVPKGIKTAIKGLTCRGAFFFVLRSLIVSAKKRALNKDYIMCIYRILPVIYYYSEICRNKKYVIMDQAIIQQYVSAYFDYCNLKMQDIIPLINIVKQYSIIPVYIKVDVDTSSRRIDIRGDNRHGRCDSITDINERKAVLTVQSNNFELAQLGLSKYMDHTFELNNDDNNSDDCRLLISDIISLLNEQIKG